MCGIIGFVSNKIKENHIELLENLIYESKIRGLHAFGISFYNSDNSIYTYKTININRLKDIIELIKKEKPNKIIYHNRYSTSGDWQVIENNQPITVDNISVAINGVITMKPKEEWKQFYQVDCISDNDAEIFARKLKQTFEPEKVLKSIHGSLASIFLYDNNIYAIRNNFRPLYLAIVDKGIFVFSTLDIFNRATKNLKAEKIIPLPSNKLIKIEDYV